VDKISEDAWNKLTTAAQIWQNAATDAVAEKAAIADFADASEPDVEEPTEAEEATEEAEEVSTQAKEKTVPRTATHSKANGKAAKTVAAKESRRRPVPAASRRAAPERAERPARAAARQPTAAKPAARGDSIPVLVRRMVIKNPSISTKQVYEALGKKRQGEELPTIPVINALRYNTVTVLRDLKSMGIIKNIDV